uniref:Uncharacterized protein n=1 Tax=Triticum urartu TaxID=4572 RepID=A0A8R7PBY6_TRIUA
MGSRSVRCPWIHAPQTSMGGDHKHAVASVSIPI